VRHEHVASLGSIENPPTARARTAFWQRLYERLAKLSNRIDPATQGRILKAVDLPISRACRTISARFSTSPTRVFGRSIVVRLRGFRPFMRSPAPCDPDGKTMPGNGL
jgi:hypothetical protein